MKYILLAIATSFTLSLNAQPVKIHGQLHVDKTQLKDSHGNDVVLRGMSFGWHNWWPRFYNAGAVKTLHEDWGATIVRAAMGVEPQGAYLDNPDFAKQKIESVVNAAIEEGIYVIIDWHSHHVRQKEAIAFFTEMAKKYGKYPNIIYEIFNEPEYDSWTQVKDYSIAVISAIRTIDKKNIILVGSPHWDQDVDIAANDPITGYNNLMYTLHYYAASHKQELRNKADYALKKGLPIFISESAGMEASGDGPIDKASWQQWIDWSEKNKISWITWSIADKDETCSVLKADAPSNGGWKTNDMKESGIMVRNYLRKYAGLENQ
ncbi:MAG TPA: glycoside hydrolase family 5 protein [Hanamia sp.]